MLYAKDIRPKKAINNYTLINDKEEEFVDLRSGLWNVGLGL